MVSSDHLRLSQQQQGLPPLTPEEELSLGEPVPSTEEQSLVKTSDFHIALYHT